MELSEAIKIVRHLAEGRDPETGERLPPGSPCLCPETARALCIALQKMDDSGVASVPPEMPPAISATKSALLSHTEKQRDTLKKLYEWRRSYASELGVPAFWVANNQMLNEALLLSSPDEAALLTIRGFGPKRVGSYGKSILEILNETGRTPVVDRTPVVEASPVDLAKATTNEVQKSATSLPLTQKTPAEARLRYPASTNILMLITEVTRMQNDVFCIAAYDLHRNRMVRPMLAGKGNWTFDRLHPGFRPGQLVLGKPGGVEKSQYPHRTEDTPMQVTMKVLETWSESELYFALSPVASNGISQIFGQGLVEGRYFLEGTRCPSLGGLNIERRRLRFCFGTQNRVRLEVTEKDGTLHSLPITCDRFRSCFDLETRPDAVLEANQRLQGLPAEEFILLRIGLSRGYSGSSGEFNPKRCFLQINGILSAKSWLPSEIHSTAS